MKTKKKTLALIEIAIVLCSVFLVAFPGIAAQEQNLGMQKVSANTITTASEDEYVLGIYGNANEDDTIDMGDVVYTKLAIFGKKPKTELCDAKYDGRINVLDVIQTKLIILGKEKELTVKIPTLRRQAAAQTVTVQKPAERIVVHVYTEAEVLRSINAANKVVGVGSHIRDEPIYFPELSKLPFIGTWTSPDYEAILNLNPDVLLAYVSGPEYVDEEKLPGVTVIGLLLHHLEGFTGRLRLLGYIIDNEEEAEDYINWHDGWINKIKSRIEGLSEDEKTRVFHLTSYKQKKIYQTSGEGNRIDQACDVAGGINIAGHLKANWPTVDPEWMIEQNPDIIVVQASIPRGIYCGYGTDDPSEMAVAREEILNRPELANVNAVKNGRVYIMYTSLACGGSCSLIGIAYMAKWFHPDLFEDLDPQAIHQEYVTRFQHLDFNVYKHGVFVYPPLE